MVSQADKLAMKTAVDILITAATSDAVTYCREFFDSGRENPINGIYADVKAAFETAVSRTVSRRFLRAAVRTAYQTV